MFEMETDIFTTKPKRKTNLFRSKDVLLKLMGWTRLQEINVSDDIVMHKSIYLIFFA